MDNQSGKLAMWLANPLPSDVKRSLEQLAAADDVRQVAVMPDVHLSGDVCVGAVVATRRLLYPAAVGGDIGCGMAAIAFDAQADVLNDEVTAGRIMAGLYRRIPAMKHAAARQLPDELQGAPLSDGRLEKMKPREGQWQFGALGRGNHFLELQADTADRLWLMVHSGSRGIGQAIANHHLAVAARHSGTKKLAAIDAGAPAGQAYLADVAWARRYAEFNRMAIIDAVRHFFCDEFAITAAAETLIGADHNHLRRETHSGEILWVHRKGAQSAFAGEPGIIPGSMGAASFHVTGRGHAAALYSSSHGAGRAMSRREAARAIGVPRLLREMRGVWFDQRKGARLLDEAPSAYKNIHAVMRAQRDLTRIERELRPLLSYKGV